MKKKILIISLLLLAGTVVAVFAAGRCKSEFEVPNIFVREKEWIQCNLKDGHRFPMHEGSDRSGQRWTWHD